MAYKRNYRKEYDEYHAKPVQKKRRADRNSARSKMMKKGKVHKDDGMEVDHVGSNRTGRLKKVPTRVVSKKKNRKRQPDRPGGQ